MSPREHFEEGCRAGELRYGWDGERAVFYPRIGQELRVSAGLGTVYSVTWVHARDAEPYNVVLVDLDEGFRMMSRVRGARPEIGMRVAVAFEDAVPVFEAVA